MRFRGKYQHAMDAKGRTSVPSRFRELYAQIATEKCGEDAQEVLVVTRGLDRGLLAFPPSAWYAFEEKISRMPALGSVARKLKRVFVAHAVECPIDKHGRILIPQALRSYAGLERDVVWVGALSNCEIWSPGRWEAAVEESMEDESLLEEALDDLVIDF